MSLYQKPLVSVCIPNYNYAQYLRNCLDSVLNQTYDNYEVILYDNNSTDESYEIALSYLPKFRQKGVYYSAVQNKYNFGSDMNTNLCLQRAEGEFTLVLASDDAIYPKFIEKCVDMFIEYPTISMVMVHRDEVDETGKITKTPPFYNQSCVIPREEQAAVFMMSGIAIPGQRLCRASAERRVKNWVCSFQVANDWYNNALYACVGDIGYISEPLMQYRVHSGNETSESERNLTAIMEHFQIINKIAKVTSEYGMTKPTKRLNEATKKLGNMCLRYAIKMLYSGDIMAAKRYLCQSRVFDFEIADSGLYQDLKACIDGDQKDRVQMLHKIEHTYTTKRTVSYDPPEGFIPWKH